MTVEAALCMGGDCMVHTCHQLLLSQPGYRPSSTLVDTTILLSFSICSPSCPQTGTQPRLQQLHQLQIQWCVFSFTTPDVSELRMMQFLPCGSVARRERGRGGSDGSAGLWGDIPTNTNSSAAPTCCPSTQPDITWGLCWVLESWAKLGHPSYDANLRDESW